MSTTTSRPQRIACLSTEAVEVLYRLGAQDRVAGISGYSVHPPQARDEKPKISGFSSMKLERIQAVQPDLVIGFSDLQRPLLEECERAGLATLWFDQRDLAGIHAMVRRLGSLVEREAEAEALSRQLQQTQDELAAAAAALPWRPRVYFEEWDEPMISGIAWVSELIDAAGGADIFPELAACKSARDRIVSSEEVIRRSPDIIIGSWCGKKFRSEKVVARPGFETIPAIKSGRLHEIKSPLILQPGPAALTDGLAALEAIISSPNET